MANLQVKEPNNLSYVTQTTLSVDETQRITEALREKFPAIRGPKRDDICYATQNRQDAVKVLAQQYDVLLVVGSPTSSNSNRLRELAEHLGTPAYLLDSPNLINWDWFKAAKNIGITAGASAPDILIKQVISALQTKLGIQKVQEITGIEENISFSMPKELREVKVQNYFKIPLVNSH